MKLLCHSTMGRWLLALGFVALMLGLVAGLPFFFDMPDAPRIARLNPEPFASTDVPTPLQTRPAIQSGSVQGVRDSLEETVSGVAMTQDRRYPLHSAINATVFWAGEEASSDNGYISNTPSAWDERWVTHFGGVDSPNRRSGYLPAGFKPRENPFYFALPYSDYDEDGLKANIRRIYWYAPINDGESLLKNRWIAISYNGMTVYAQWEDVGPFEDDDVEYVFGDARPKRNVGLDVSPAVRDFLEMGDQALVSWRFVEKGSVPKGPWTEIITTSGPMWE